MKLSLIQFTVGSDFEKNFENAKKYIHECKKTNPNFILFPECFLFLSNKKKFHLTMDNFAIKFFQDFAEKNHFSVVREYCGHGIGKEFHEEPQILHYGKKGEGLKLEEGMTFTIEPMINFGKKEIRILPDNWTVVTKDHSLSAQWEHTILVTKNAYEVLTLRPEESI